MLIARFSLVVKNGKEINTKNVGGEKGTPRNIL